MVGEERVRVLIQHVVRQVMPRVAHEDGEEGQSDHDGVEDVVRPDRETLVLRLERVAGVPVNLDDRDLFGRCGGGGSRAVLLDLVAHMAT